MGVVAGEDHVGEGAEEANDARQAPRPEPKADLAPPTLLAPVVACPTRARVDDISDHAVDREGGLHGGGGFPAKEVVALREAILEPVWPRLNREAVREWISSVGAEKLGSSSSSSTVIAAVAM